MPSVSSEKASTCSTIATPGAAPAVPQAENKFIEKHGFGEYALWHLGIDDEQDVDTKARYKFPYGDFKKVHRCGVIAAEVRAARQKYEDIKSAAVELLEMLDELM